MLVLSCITSVFAQFIVDVQYMNFGNYYFALTNSMWAIRHCKSSCIVIQSHPNAVFRPPFSVTNHNGAINTTVLQTITGSFHYELISKYITSSSPSLTDRLDIMCPYVELVRASLPISDGSHDKFLDDDTLVAHIRSGDIFVTSIHPQYWQPPLGYYQYVARSFAKIAICAENTANPVVMALHTFCIHTRGHAKCLLRVGQPLTSDVAFLTRAKNLAIGYGTFGVAICALSRSLKRLFYPMSTAPHGMIRYLDFGSLMTPKHCVNSSSPISIAVKYNTTQITFGEQWKATPRQLASLLIDQSQLEDLREIQNNKLYSIPPLKTPGHKRKFIPSPFIPGIYSLGE